MSKGPYIKYDRSLGGGGGGSDCGQYELKNIVVLRLSCVTDVRLFKAVSLVKVEMQVVAFQFNYIVL